MLIHDIYRVNYQLPKIKSGRKIHVMVQKKCNVCLKPYMAKPYQYACSDLCQIKADNDAENWREEC